MGEDSSQRYDSRQIIQFPCEVSSPQRRDSSFDEEGINGEVRSKFLPIEDRSYSENRSQASYSSWVSVSPPPSARPPTPPSQQQVMRPEQVVVMGQEQVVAIGQEQPLDLLNPPQDLGEGHTDGISDVMERVYTCSKPIVLSNTLMNEHITSSPSSSSSSSSSPSSASDGDGGNDVQLIQESRDYATPCKMILSRKKVIKFIVDKNLNFMKKQKVILAVPTSLSPRQPTSATLELSFMPYQTEHTPWPLRFACLSLTLLGLAVQESVALCVSVSVICDGVCVAEGKRNWQVLPRIACVEMMQIVKHGVLLDAVEEKVVVEVSAKLIPDGVMPTPLPSSHDDEDGFVLIGN